MRNILLIILVFLCGFKPNPVKLSSTKIAQGAILGVSQCSPAQLYSNVKWGTVDAKFFQNPVRKQCQIAFFAIPFDAPVGSQTLLLGNEKIAFEITEKKFAFEKLSVDPAKVTLSEKDQERFEQDKKIVQEIYAKPDGDLLWKHRFKMPLKAPT